MDALRDAWAGRLALEDCVGHRFGSGSATEAFWVSPQINEASLLPRGSFGDRKWEQSQTWPGSKLTIGVSYQSTPFSNRRIGISNVLCGAFCSGQNGAFLWWKAKQSKHEFLFH